MLDAFNVSLVFFAHRLMRVHRPWIERTIVAAFVLATSAYALWDLPQLARYNNLVHSALMLAPVYLVVWLVGIALRHRNRDAIVFSACISLLLGLGIHDAVLNSLAVPQLWATRFFLLQFGAPVMLLVMVVHLAMRLNSAVGETRVANVRLEARVKEATRALEDTFGRQRLLERRQAAAAERDRIYQDLHDDVGARLLSLVYAAGEGKPAEMARAALREIRTIVSNDRVEGGLAHDIVADWRAETQERCDVAGFALEWESNLDRQTRLTGLQHYHLARVMRELVSNSLEHSGGATILVAIDIRDGELHISYADDGRGFERPGHSGRGVSGLEHRVTRLGGAVAWSSATDGNGTQCRISLPLPQMEGGVAGDTPLR
jgi:signal transduction histidine kinase